QWSPILVENADLVRPTAPHSTWALQPFLRADDGAGSFRTGEHFPDHRSEPVQHPLLDRDRARRRTVDYKTQRGDVIALARALRQRQHAHKHGRHEEAVGDALPI